MTAGLKVGRAALLGMCLSALAGACQAETQVHTAKIVLEGDIPLQEAPQMIPGRTVWRLPACTILNVFGNGTVQYVVDLANRPEDPLTVDVCPIDIRLEGYRPTIATLRQDAVIVLKRLGAGQGSSISMTSLQAPPAAKKSYESGVAAMMKKKWDVAQQELARAVAVYPPYAPAWSELGDALAEQSKPDEARDAWEHAVEADPKYLKPYQQLAKQALDEGRNQDALRIADQGVALNPVEFPGIYYYDAVANYNLKNLDAAEKLALKAIRLDFPREIPLAESLLGSVLAAKGDRAGAIEHLRRYLELSPKASDAAEVERLAAKLERGE
ncbi:MAG TPA: tetratricopeptide repeat protein [Bryobacteraceae bacterium]|nr:tetratricopeptide repeat protein [Bryobacteraceae bacterium]